MNQIEQQPDFLSNQKSAGTGIDFKRILYQAIRYWYLLVLSLLVAVSTAFIVNRYSTRIYPVTASIIIKGAKDMSGGELLYNNPLVNYQRNYLNELYIIKSYPLIQSVIEELNFGVAFYSEGNFLVTEAYDYIPVDAHVLNPEQVGSSKFLFTIVSRNQYELSQSEDSETKTNALVFSFGDTIKYNGLEMLVNIKWPDRVDEYINNPFIFTYRSPHNITGSYVQRLRVNWAEQGAGVIDMNINTPNPNKDKHFLEGLIRSYQDYDLEKKNQTASRTVAFITDQLRSISDSLRTVEQQLERFKNKNVVTDLNNEALRIYQKIENLDAQKATLILSSNYYKYLIDYVKQNQNLDQIILPSSVGINDPILSGLISRMIEMQLDLKMMRKKDNPLVIESRGAINEIREDIVESVENQRSTDQIKANYIEKQIRDAEKELGYLPIAERTYVSIQRNYTLLENLYIFLLQKRSEAAISKASNTSDIIIVNPPMLGQAISPKPGRNYMIGGIVGLSIPVLILFLLELVNNRIQSREDIEKVTTIPFVGGIGHSKTMTNLEVLQRPKTMIAESFRALRSNLNYFIGKKDKGVVILITSSISGEGKTFASINLASVIALGGRRTLIVGADLRRPKLYGDFNLSNDRGLCTFLAGLSTFDEVIQPTSYENLHLVSGGPVPPNPSELLLTPRMKTFIDEAMKRYDYVIVDTPPLAIVTDAFVLSAYADHTLFLVRQNYTLKDLLRTAQDFYASGKLKNISIVLNDIYKSGPGYGYGYGYDGYGYGYSYSSSGKGGNSDYYDE